MTGNRRRLWLVLTAVVAAAGLSVPAASAGGAARLALLPSCGVTSHPFAQWNDNSAYCAFSNLGFENGKTAWTLTGSTSIVAANEPWHVSGPGTHALQLGPGATALSSSLPVSLLDPWLRFFAHSAGANGPLHVQVVFHGLLGNLTGVLNVGALSPPPTRAGSRQCGWPRSSPCPSPRPRLRWSSRRRRRRAAGRSTTSTSIPAPRSSAEPDHTIRRQGAAKSSRLHG